MSQDYRTQPPREWAECKVADTLSRLPIYPTSPNGSGYSPSWEDEGEAEHAKPLDLLGDKIALRLAHPVRHAADLELELLPGHELTSWDAAPPLAEWWGPK